MYFHPLSRFPGPNASAFTRIPYIHALFTGSFHRYVARLHDQYGEVVRISPDELSFIGATTWRDINGYGSKTGPGSPPPKHFEKYGEDLNGVENLILMKDDAEHTRVRKIFSPAFSDRALIQQAPLFLKYTNQLIQVLHDKIKANGGEDKVDIVRMYNFTTFDIMGDLTFGESLHMLDNQQYDEWVAMIFASMKVGIRVNSITQHYAIAMRIMKFALKKFLWEMAQKHLDHSATRVTKRIEKGRSSEGVDIWDLVLSQEEQGKEGLGRLQMDSNASLFMLAGTETTATLLSGLTYLLLKTPKTMEKLKKEVRTSFASSEDISMDAIARLPYLNACIKEGLRCYPPVPIGLPHLTPSDGSTICGQFIPPGVSSVPLFHSSFPARANSPATYRLPSLSTTCPCTTRPSTSKTHYPSSLSAGPATKNTQMTSGLLFSLSLSARAIALARSKLSPYTSFLSQS